MAQQYGLKAVYKGEDTWPYVAPKSFKEESPWGGLGSTPTVLDIALCHCPRHHWNHHLKRARHLKEKEGNYRSSMLKTAQQRSELDEKVIRSKCVQQEDIERLKAIHSSHRTRARGGADRRRREEALLPVALLSNPNTMRFREFARKEFVVLQAPDIQAPKPLDFSSCTEPAATEASPFMSEYMQRISIQGLMTSLQAKSGRFRFIPSRDME